MMEKHLNNALPLTLASHKRYDLANNRGRITIGSHCTVSCEDNSGQIFLGSDCKILNCNRNREFISIGSNSVIAQANENAGQLEIGSHSVIRELSYNRGKITIGNHCKIPAAFHGNTGHITTGLHCEILAEGAAAVCPSPSAGAPAGGWGTFDTVPEMPSLSPRHGTTPTQPPCRSPMASSPVPGPQMGFVAPAHGHHAPYPTSPTAPATSCTVTDPLLPAPPLPVRNVSPVGGGGLLCGLCKGRRRDTAFSCGHSACNSCSVGLTVCHVCRIVITQKIKLVD